jgi:phosphate/sulfate permease
MNVLTILALSIAAGLALNIGANNAGVHMAPAFGAGARGKWASLVLFAVFALAGALTLGQKVTETVGKGLFTASLGTHPWLFLVVAPVITVVLLSLSNYLRQPVPTTLVAICSLLGVGLAHGILNGHKVLVMLVWWVVTPFATLATTWTAGKILHTKFPALLNPATLSPRTRSVVGWLLTIEGCYSSFAIGSNNVAKSIGPIVGAGTLSPLQATILGGTGMAIGGLLWGGRVLETVGKGITELCYVRALVVGVAAATGLVIASVFGAPVSGACIVTMGVIGFGMATHVKRTEAESRNVRRIAILWATGPAFAILVSYVLVLAVR